MTTTPTGIDWNVQLLEQLKWHWGHQRRPRLKGMSDAAYLWEPTAGCWNVRLGQDGLAAPCGPVEGPYAEYPMAALVLHIHREVIHHGAEVALLRDLYRSTEGHAVS